MTFTKHILKGKKKREKEEEEEEEEVAVSSKKHTQLGSERGKYRDD